MDEVIATVQGLVLTDNLRTIGSHHSILGIHVGVSQNRNETSCSVFALRDSRVGMVLRFE